MNKSLSTALFIILAIIQLSIPARMIWQLEDVRSDGKEYKFITVPVDPNDPFRGKYVALSFKENNTFIDRTQMWHPGEEVYVYIRNDKDGFAKITSASKTPSQSANTFIIAKVAYQADDQLFINYPFDRFYVKETIAPEIERLYENLLRDTSRNTYALVSVLNGKSVLTDIMVDGSPIKELVNSQ